MPDDIWRWWILAIVTVSLTGVAEADSDGGLVTEHMDKVVVVRWAANAYPKVAHGWLRQSSSLWVHGGYFCVSDCISRRLTRG